MRYLTVTDFGSFLGISSQCLVVKQNGEIIKEIALSHLRGISIAKSGVSISADLVQACANRGIKIFFLDFRSRVISAVIGQNQHATVALRKSQFNFISNDSSCFELSKQLVLTKVRNQRAVLLYFSKYLRNDVDDEYQFLVFNIRKINSLIEQIKELHFNEHRNWRNSLLGLEGLSARFYFETLANTSLFPDDFIKREGRYARSITNQSLNWSYAILESYVWQALDNAGLEVFAGIYHTDRPGKPSLVLDLMEEYRAWVVDRNLIKLRDMLSSYSCLNNKLKIVLTNAVHQTMQTKYPYNNKKVKLENILQRQAYKLAGAISGSNKYKDRKSVV